MVANPRHIETLVGAPRAQGTYVGPAVFAFGPGPKIGVSPGFIKSSSSCTHAYAGVCSTRCGRCAVVSSRPLRRRCPWRPVLLGRHAQGMRSHCTDQRDLDGAGAPGMPPELRWPWHRHCGRSGPGGRQLGLLGRPTRRCCEPGWVDGTQSLTCQMNGRGWRRRRSGGYALHVVISGLRGALRKNGSGRPVIEEGHGGVRSAV